MVLDLGPIYPIPKRKHEFRYSQFGFRPHSYVKKISDIIRMRAFASAMQAVKSDIFPSKCESYVIGKRDRGE